MVDCIKIYVSNVDAYKKNAINTDLTYSIKHNRTIKDHALYFNYREIADKVIFISGDDYKLYTADIEETITKKSMDNVEGFSRAMLGTIIYYTIVLFD